MSMPHKNATISMSAIKNMANVEMLAVIGTHSEDFPTLEHFDEAA